MIIVVFDGGASGGLWVGADGRVHRILPFGPAATAGNAANEAPLLSEPELAQRPRAETAASAAVPQSGADGIAAFDESGSPDRPAQ